MDDFFRANFAKLKGSESKLLFTLRELGLDQASKAEIKRVSGVTHPNTFYDAWRKLEEDGWFDWLRSTTKTVVPDYENRSVDYEKRSDHYENRTTKTVSPDTEIVAPDTEIVSMNFEIAFELADAMDAGGVQTSLKSPYQQRRKKQCVLLQEAWAELFPKDPVDPQAFTLLLQAAHDSSSEVYRAMLEASLRKVEHPKAYILAILKSPKKQQPASDPEVLRPVTDEQRKAWQENEKQLAGVLSGWSF